jgi:hypothetical protein
MILQDKSRSFEGESPLEAAKQALDIFSLWEALYLPGRPGKSCRSPFREDRKPSFSIFDNGRAFKDHSTGEAGGLVEFVQLAAGLDNSEACRYLIELSNTGSVAAPTIQRRPTRESKPCPFTLPQIDSGSITELDVLARSRGLPLFAGIQILADRGNFAFYNHPEGRAWLVYDRAGRVAQGRLLSGQWQAGMKAKTLPGSRTSWPVGASTITPETELVYFCEGGPDLIAAATAVFLAVPEQLTRSAFVAMLGASQAIAEGALHLFTGKQIRIFAHADDAGVAARDKWARQLIDIEPAALSAWQSDTPGEDLNDFLQADHHNDEIIKELIL